MKVEVTDLSPVKKSMSIEVDPDEVRKETEKVVRGYAQKARVPGFRAGKVPLDIVRKRFAKEVDEDVKERLVSRSYHDAAHEKGLHPLGDPVLEDLTWEDGKPLSFKTTFEVMPKFEAKSYKEVEVRRPNVAVEDAEVDKALEDLRQARATLETEEGRKAVTGDVVVTDVEGRPDEGEPFNRERMMIELGGTDNLPAFNEKLEGVEAGSEPEFSVEYPKEYPAEELAGKTVGYRLKVHEVKVRRLPELDDEFAKDLGDFDDLAALRARVREDLEARKAREADGAVRQSLLDKILVENPVVLPEILVDEEIRHRLEDLVRHLMQQGMDPSKMELDWKDLRKRQEEPARKSVHARLLLDAVARAESIEVSQKEVEERLRRDAAAMGRKIEEFKKTVREHGGTELLKSQILREKSLDYLTSVANIQEEE